MSRFERIEVYPDTYLTLLPVELQKYLALYVYNCNFYIGGNNRGIIITSNGLSNIISLSKAIFERIPELVIAIDQRQPKILIDNNLYIQYSGSDHISLAVGAIRIMLPLCKNIMDLLKKIGGVM